MFLSIGCQGVRESAAFYTVLHISEVDVEFGFKIPSAEFRSKKLVSRGGFDNS